MLEMNVMRLGDYKGWGNLELVGVRERKENDEVTVTSVYFLLRVDEDWADPNLNWLRVELTLPGKLRQGFCVVDPVDGCDPNTVLFARSVKGQLRKPWRFLQATARVLEDEMEAHQAHLEHQDELAAREASREYHEQMWDAPPSMDEPGYPGGPR
tara:strand:- start:93 stop:557 length:465 start_codon:yes stop_codon:yes gene_type:complete